MAKRIRTTHKKALVEIYDTLFDSLGPQQWWPGDTPFEIAVGAILTQNTNWGNVEKAINNLKYKKCLSANTLHKMSHKKLASLIRPAGYFNIKAKRLKNFLSFLATNFKSSMNRMKSEDTNVLREQLLDVNGIGPETADSILLYALDKPIFVIDAYTKRVLSRHKLAAENPDYHELQDLFHNHLPMDRKLFNEFHALFVMVGKNYCKPKPKCDGCPLEGLR
jgi:endonuclease-3 related protein